ncbi:hypothetical protein Tco_0909988, partial [Tanacetum coccineum]
MAGEDENHDENANIPPPVPPTQQAPHTLSTIKLPILKKGEYDIWAMKMEHYLGHTDYPIWEVIQKGNGPVQVSTDTNGQIRVLPPKTAEEILAREREIKARTTLLMFIPEDHLVKFHKITDAKEMWEAIKFRFEGLHKGYDRFQSLLSQLEIHGAGVSTEDSNQKFVRVFEYDVKGSTASSSNTQNVVFVSSESTSSTNDVSTAYGVSTSSAHNSQKEGSSSYTIDSNIISYSQYLSETQQETVQNSNSSAQQDVLILSMFEQLTTQVTRCTNVNLEYKSVNQALTTELDRYKEEVKDLKEMQNVENSFLGSNEQYAEIVRLKETLFEQVQKKDSLMKTVSDLKKDLKMEENRNIDREITLEKKIISFSKEKVRESKPKLYDGNVILKMDAIVIPDSDETLMLCEESHSKMLLKEQDLMV